MVKKETKVAIVMILNADELLKLNYVSGITIFVAMPQI
jgi:hypothetical protein